MASFFQKYSMGIGSINWCKDKHFSKETTLEEVLAATNHSPKSPLDLDFEKETGVTTGLGLVPHLARLWEEDPYDKRIAFGINLGMDLFSRSLIKLSIANTFGWEFAARLFSYPSAPTSLFSPISHTTLIGSLPDMNLPDHEMLFDPEYFLFIRDENHEIDDQSILSDVLFPIDSELEDDHGLSENHNEQVHDDSFDGMQAQKTSRLAHEEESTCVIARTTNPITTHTDNASVMEQPRSFVGGLSAVFGVRANMPVPSLENQHPTEDIMIHDASPLLQETTY